MQVYCRSTNRDYLAAFKNDPIFLKKWYCGCMYVYQCRWRRI